jgi:hypothetical protein
VTRFNGAAIIVIAALVIWPSLIHATAIVALRTHNRIVLAADSLAITYRPTEMTGAKQTTCKVYRAGRFAFASGSMLSGGKVNIASAVARAIRNAATIEAALGEVAGVWTKQVLPVVQGYSNDPTLLSRFHQGAVMSIIVATMDGAIPKLGAFQTSLVSTSPVRFTTQRWSCPGSACPDGGFAVLGTSRGGAMNEVIRTKPAWLLSGSPGAARQIIDLEIIKTPGFVSAPVDVLEITASGARWVNRDPKSACPAIGGGKQ